MSHEPYEFSQEQNELLVLLARLMRYVALLFIFVGIVFGIYCGFAIVKHPFRGISYLLQTILSIIFGVWTNSVSYSFKQIVETTGKDMEILMEAMKTLKRVYILQFVWLVIIATLFLAMLIINTISGYQAISLFNIN